MAFIRYVPEEESPEELKAIVREYKFEPWDKLDNILRIHGPNPKSMKFHYDYYIHLMRKPGPLSRVQREMVAVSVSVANQCHY